MNPNCKSILLVEDDFDLREDFREILAAEGFHIHVAENGLVALNFLKNCPKEDLPGCIILDLMMPVMDGIEFMSQVQRDHAHDFALIPILVATASSGVRFEIKKFQLNVCEIRKPMDLETLILKVTEHCGRPAAHEERAGL